jgi:hypothetical protein
VASYDPQVLNAIFARANEVSDPSKRNRYLRAALQTGIVESGLRNLDYGDADSQGWRQERASLYPNPTNIAASVNRFFEEAAQHDRGQPSWELAADVQRPAAQYRGRYKTVAQQAAALLNRAGVPAPAASGRTESAAGGLSAAPAAPAIIDGGQAGDFTSLLATLGQKPQTAAPVSSALPASPLAPKVALPQGFQGQQATPQEQAPSAQSGLLEALRGADPTNGSSGQSGASAADSVLSVMERVAAARSPKPAPELAAAAPEQTAATIKAGAEGGLDGIVAEMDRIDAAKVPYLWGGGHQKKAKPGAKVTPLDCSGAVSQALGIDPRVSGQFESWGKAGRGKLVTIYANDTHVLMHVKGRGFWGTSKSNPGGGAGWIDDGQVSSAYLSRFTARHPRGL